MMLYYVLFDDDTGCEFEARDRHHAEQQARVMYPNKAIKGKAVPCEYLDLPF